MEGAGVSGIAKWTWAFAAVALFAPALAAGDDELAPNDPRTCKWTEGDPELLKSIGIVSTGGFDFGRGDTAAIDKELAMLDIYWVETEHFEIGIGLGPYRVKQKEREKIRGELRELATKIPTIKEKTKIIDPWLRCYIYAQRVEALYDRFLELMQVEETDFPTGRGQWNMEGKYMGDGPYLGQRHKFEILLLPSEAASVLYLKSQFGLQVRLSQRWNVIERDSISVTIHTTQGDLRDDQALHGHLAFNLAINMLDGYKHYSYDTPIWIREGLAHFMEREINPDFNTFDSSEGAVADMTRKSDWTDPVRKLIRAGEAPRLAELVRLKDYGELTVEHHFTTWSMVAFLVAEHPDAFACINDRLHGIWSASGPDGSNMPDHHREAVKECLGWSYAQFDDAWQAWAVEQ